MVKGGMTKRARAKRDALATANLPLVVSIARSIHAKLPASFDLADLIAEGNIALLKAATLYDPAGHNGTPFSAFARQRIRGAMLETCRRSKYTENTRLSIDDPGNSIAGWPQLRDHGESDAKYDTEQWRAFLRMATQPTAPVAIDRARCNAGISSAISWLSPDERNLLHVWYADDEPNLRTVARRLKITPAQAEELHAGAIAGLQARLTGNALPKSELPKAA